MNFIPNTEKETKEMLKTIGVSGIHALFRDIDRKIILPKDLNLPKPLSEFELRNLMLGMSRENKIKTSFLGAGSYSHFIPSVVNHVISRSEFYTAYTPYQPEISQGVLQSIFEYQTMICELTGMDVANASMYDGASALAESVVMAKYIKGRDEILISKSVHPEHREVAETYAKGHDIKIREIEFRDGVTSIEDLKNKITENTAAVIVQNPNFFGCIENLGEIGKIAHSKDSLFIVNITEPTSLGLLRPPGESGADIVVGEGQSFGNPVNFGGPYLGIIATKMEFMRKIPGRLVGETTDTEGRRGFILTLQAREQHIRREKASSNICTNEALCALAASVHLAMLGKGLKDLAGLNLQKAHYAYEKITSLNGYGGLSKKPFYNEFVIKCKDSKKANAELLKNDIVGGLDLGRFYPELKNYMLFCVTEVVSKEEIDRLVDVLEGVK